MSLNCIPKIKVIGLSIPEIWDFNSGYHTPNGPKMRFFVQISEFHGKSKFFLGGIDRSSYQGIIFGRGKFWVKRCGPGLKIYQISQFYKMALPAAPRRLRNQRFLRLLAIARPAGGNEASAGRAGKRRNL